MTLFHDLRHAIRSLRGARGFALVSVLTLASGIALSTTAFAVMDAYLLRSLPYPGAERLYSVRYGTPGEEPRQMDALDWASLADVIEHPIAWDLDVFYLLGGDHAEPFPGAWVTPGFMQGLGVQAAHGPGLGPEAFTPGGPTRALISHRLWSSRFGADPAAVGRTFTAYVSDRPEEAESFTIAGVLPVDFWHINVYTDIIAPLRAPSYPYMVRLRPGVAVEEAAARIEALVRSGTATPERFQVALVSTHGSYVSTVRPVLRAAGTAAVLVFLVGCANVAGLTLVRAVKRRKELAIRAALGAGRAALVRMITAESIVLAFLATGLAVCATDLILSALGPLLQEQIGRRAPRGDAALVLTGRTLLISACLGLLAATAGVLASLPGALRPAGVAGADGSSRTATEGRRSARVRSGLIALEIAVSFALLAGSALMVRSIVTLLRTDVGFSAERVLQASVTLRHSRYPDDGARAEALDRIASRLDEIPGIESVALTTAWPVQQPRLQPVAPAVAGKSGTMAPVHRISDAYFAALGTPLKAGRAFDSTDVFGSEPVAIVSESLARRLWPAGDPVGTRILVPEERPGQEPVPLSRRVVGVAADIRQGPADDERADVYVPLAQVPGRFAFVLVRTAGHPLEWVGPVREAFRDIDPEIAVYGLTALQATLDQLSVRPRFLAGVLTAFGIASALVALVGVYGVIAYAVRQRQREIAVRMAVGADPARLTTLFVSQGAVMLAAGLSAGALGALAAGRLIESQLVGVTPRDPVSLAGAAVLLAFAGIAAVWWPARKAARTDPAIALRSE